MNVAWQPGPQPSAAFAVAKPKLKTDPANRIAANSFLMSSPCVVWLHHAV
jgi:hypothetical protein